MAGDDAPASSPSQQQAAQEPPTPPPPFATANLLDLSAINSGRFMVMRYERASAIVWPEGCSPDSQVLAAPYRVWVTAGGACVPLTGPLTALALMDAVLKLERGEPVDKTYAPDETDEWTAAQLDERTNDLAGETPWVKMNLGFGGGYFCQISMMAMFNSVVMPIPGERQCAKCPRRGFCGLALYGRKKATGEPVYRPLWSGLFCAGCGLGRNFRVPPSLASFEAVRSPASTFFTPARGMP